MTPAAAINETIRRVLVAAGARSNVNPARFLGIRHPEQWGRYVSGAVSPTTSTVQGWLESWAAHADAHGLPRLRLMWTAGGAVAREEPPA